MIRLSKKIWFLDSLGVILIDDFDEFVIRGGFFVDKIEELVKLVVKFIGRILEMRKEVIIEKFGIMEFESEEDIFRKIGERRGFIKVGGEVDIEEMVRWFFCEW